MSLSKGALGPEAAAGAASALESAIEDLREKYAKKEIEERKAATASAAAAEPAPAAEGEGSDDEWLDDPGATLNHLYPRFCESECAIHVSTPLALSTAGVCRTVYVTVF